MIVFEIDDTILRGKFIDACADKFVFDEELPRLRSIGNNTEMLMKSIAKLFCGLSKDELLQVISNMTLIGEAAKVVKKLQQDGNIVGIISNSFQFAVDYIKLKIGADFAIGNRMEFINGKATGEISIPLYYYYRLEKKCRHTYCKTNALIYAAQNYGIPIEHTISVGAAAEDLCITTQSGIGIAFCPKDRQLMDRADKIITKPTFAELLNCELLIDQKKMVELKI